MNRKRNRLQTRSAAATRSPRLWHPEVPGPLWDGSQRVSRRQIETYCQVVAREFQPRKIILFGSYAAGSATPDSDVDLVVVMPHRGASTEQVVRIRGRVEAPFPMDLLIWRPGRLRRSDSFARTIRSEGKTMYESRAARV